MKYLNRFLALGWSALLFCTATTELAAEFGGAVTELELSGGWRRDDFRSFVFADDATDTVRGNNLDIWQIGLKGRIEPHFDVCGCWADGIFARGYAYWGSVNDGDYSHRIKYDPVSLEQPVTSQISRDVGNTDSGKTWDYKIGMGYLFELMDGVRVGPTVGYSYDKLRFKGSNIVGVTATNFTNSDNPFNQDCTTIVDEFTCGEEGVRFSSKWQGPWIGLDAQFQYCDFELNAGYEYHWSDWRGAYTLAGSDPTDCYHYSDKRKSNKSRGQEGFINVQYNVNCSWVVGLGLEYKYYRQPNSTKFKPANGSLTDVGCVEGQINTIRSKWRSTALTLDVGYLF